MVAGVALTHGRFAGLSLRKLSAPAHARHLTESVGVARSPPVAAPRLNTEQRPEPAGTSPNGMGSY